MRTSSSVERSESLRAELAALDIGAIEAVVRFIARTCRPYARRAPSHGALHRVLGAPGSALMSRRALTRAAVRACETADGATRLRARFEHAVVDSRTKRRRSSTISTTQRGTLVAHVARHGCRPVSHHAATRGVDRFHARYGRDDGHVRVSVPRCIPAVRGSQPVSRVGRREAHVIRR